MVAKNKQQKNEQTQYRERLLEKPHESSQSKIKTGKPNMLLSQRVDSRGPEHAIKLKGQNLVNRDIEVEAKCNRIRNTGVPPFFSTH